MEQKYDKYALFRRGADDGFIFGVYLTAMFFAMAYSQQIPMLSLIAMVLMLGVPFYTYFFLRRAYVAELGTTNFSALWMQGIVMFFCGSLIMALTSFVFMRWIEPEFILTQMESLAEAYRQLNMTGSEEMADTFQNAIDRGMIPTPIQVAMQLIWTGVFTGSILSIVMALIVPLRKLPTKPN